MTMQHKENGDRTVRHYAIAAGKGIAVVIVLSLLTHLSWNLFAPDLFGLPSLHMKQALGLVVFAGVLTFMLRHGVRGDRHG